jgi:hypothetical protein
MTTETTKSIVFLDRLSARILAAAILAVSVIFIVLLNRGELFSNQTGEKVNAMFPAFTSCRDEEYEKLARMAADAPDKWSAETMVRAKQAANAMCIKKTASQTGAN